MKKEIAYLRQDPTLSRWGGVAVQVLVVGVGQEAVRSSLRRWLEAPNSVSTNGSTSIRPNQLLLLGFAGAVDPALACGDLALAGRYYLDRDTTEEAGKDYFEADSSCWSKPGLRPARRGWHGAVWSP